MNKEASLAEKLLSTSSINTGGVYEQRIYTTKSHKLRLISDDFGDKCMVRGLFLPSNVEYPTEAVAQILILGHIITSIPMRLISALNTSETNGFMEFSFDKFFSDSIHLYLFEKICVCELQFVNMPFNMEFEVLFECCWLRNKELVKMKDAKFDHLIKQVMPHQLQPYKRVQFKKNVDKMKVAKMNGDEYSRIINNETPGDYIIEINGKNMRNCDIVSELSSDGEYSLLLAKHPIYIQNQLTIQNLIVCDKKENIKSVVYNCVSDDLIPVSVIDYDERLVSIYGIKVNDAVTAFNMNPGKPWDCHYPEGNFNVNKFNKERLVVERKERSDEVLDVYFLATNHLHYEKGVAGIRFAW